MFPVCPPQCDKVTNQSRKEGKSPRSRTLAVDQVSDSRAPCWSICITPFHPHSPAELVLVLVVLLLSLLLLLSSDKQTEVQRG